MGSLVRRKSFLIGAFIMILALIIACGEETAETEAPAAQPDAATPAAATPAAAPGATAAPDPGDGMMMPSGSLDFGAGDIGAEVYVLGNQAYQATVFDGRTTHEHMWGSDGTGAIVPRLVKSFEDSENADGSWSRTFTLQQGAKWHDRYGDWGEFNADDFIFTMTNVATEGSVHTNSGKIRALFHCDVCSMEKIDEYTVRLNRPEPTFQIEWWNTAPVGNTTMRSARHYEATGDDEASKQSVGTGSFQLMDSLADDYKRAEAVMDHWRKTPEFAEFTWHQLAEESTRLANYLTGAIDTGQFSTDSIQAIKNDDRDEDQYVVFRGARLRWVHVHAQNYYPDHPSHESEFVLGDGASYTDTCKTQAWVSCDRDVNSDEWARALKIRTAMTVAIDRQAMINNLAFGDAVPAYTFGFMGHDARAQQYGLDQLTWEYDPARAKELLAEGGHPDGFEIEVHLTNTGGVGVDTSGEVLSGLWRQIGIEAKHVVQPYSSFRPTILARTAKGVRPDEQGVGIEPLFYYSIFYVANNTFNFGIEHPDLQGLIDKANVTYDVDERWAVSADISRWLHENIGTIPLYEENATWPLGPEISEWEMSPLHIEWLNNWEYAAHR